MFKIRNKIHVISPSIVIVLLIIISVFFGIYTATYIRRDKIKDFQYTTQSKSEEAVEFLRSIEKDIIFLNNNIFLSNLIDAMERKDTAQINHCKFEVEMLFKTFSESRRIYDQIRYIDITGHEIVRVDIEGKDAYVVPQEELQDKGHRYYFKEAVKLDEGNIYVSELDLNREEGLIEAPYKPMLRYAIPVLDREKQTRGILVLNVLADYLLKNILTDKFLNGTDSYLLNRDGFYLLHPEISKQWGGLNNIDTGENVKNDLPQETVSHILLGKSGIKSANKQFFNFIPIYFDPSNHERYWIFAKSLHKSVVYSPIYTFLAMLGIIISVLIAGVVMFSFTFSKRLVNPLRALAKGTKQIADGDLEHTITIDKRNNEIIELTESFNLMVKKLRESNKENRQLFLQVKRGRDEWQNTFDVITDIITIHDKDFRIIRANKAFLEKFNVSAEELSDRKCHEIFHDTSEPWPTCPLTKTAESLKTEYVEIDDPNMGGSFIVSTYPILDEKGELYGVVHQAKDITERKKAEEEIRRGKEYTESLIETAQDAIVCIDKNGIINIWNESAEKIFGYKKSEIIGKPITTIIPVKVLVGFLHMSKIKKISKAIEVSGKTKDGNVIPLEMSISSQKIEEGLYTFTMIIRDITFQKEAKKQLAEKANMLATINKELEEFVYIVSHDLKEPLFTIEGYTSRLYRAYKDIYDDKEKYYIERIRTNVKRMSQKIQEIMEVLKAGRIVYDFRKNDSSMIIREVINSLEGRIRAEKINVIVEPNLPVVFCDERRMKDVFSNLVTNAIKFMGNDKQTESPINPPRSQANTPRSQAELGNEQMGDGRSKRIRIGCRKNEDYYKFFVEDTGIGIREEYQEQVFKIFKRLRDIETEGTGVGLAIVKKIVELHGGKLWVEGPLKDGRGSRFCFTIPIMKEYQAKKLQTEEKSIMELAELPG